MRDSIVPVTVFLMALGGAALSAASCHSDADDCMFVRTCGGGGMTSSSSGASGSTSSSSGMGGASSSSSSSGMGGAGGGTPNCDPLKGAVDDSCGVFVSSSKGKPGNPGTKAKPFASFTEALAKMPKALYACGETFNEAVSVTSPVTIYGALDCAQPDWTYTAAKPTALTAPKDSIPLSIDAKADKVTINDVAATSLDASAGKSSIAALVLSGQADFVRCVLQAGNGGDGAPGMNADPNPPMKAPDGNPGSNACTNKVTVPGGPQQTLMCGADTSIGGKGGDGNVANGGDGQTGQFGVLGAPGKGELMGGWSCGQGGANGGAGSGDNGVAGTPGTAATKAAAKLTAAGDYQGVDGGDGGPGTPGQGGGGGGGAKGGATLCLGMTPGAGASGGSGGPGGCGGLGGGGGKAGGASIALVSIAAMVTLTDCTLKSAKGGKGGQGGDSQPGALGGSGGKGGMPVGISHAGCSGGDGGQGGPGGPGGGGLGGPSLGIASTGTMPTLLGTTSMKITPGAGGTGGPGGNANAQGNAGSDGASAPTQEF